MSSTDVRNRTGSRHNGDLIADAPISSTAPSTDQALIYDDALGYWMWRDVITPTTTQTINDLVRFDSTLKIGANGTALTRLNGFVGPNFVSEFLDGAGLLPFDINPDFPSVPSVNATLVTSVDNIETSVVTLYDVKATDLQYKPYRNFAITNPSSAVRVNGIIYF